MSLSLGSLSSSFSEIVHASQHNTNLIGSLFGTQVQAVTWQRWIVWIFYKIVDCFVQESWEVANLRKAMEKTNDEFAKQKDFLVQNYEEFTELFRKKTANTDFTDKETERFKALDGTITYWNNEMTPLLNEGMRTVIDKVKPFSPVALGVDGERMVLISEHQIFSKVAGYRKLKELELASHAEIPFHALEALGSRKKMTTSDGKPNDLAKQIDQWIGQLNYYNNQVSVKLLDEALRVFVDMAKTPGSELNLDLLEFQLKNRGCTIFDQKDPEVMDFRKKISDKKLTTVICQNEQYEILEALATSKMPDDDRCATYLVQSVDKQTKVLEIGSNTTGLRLKYAEAKRYQESKPVIPIVLPEKVDDKGILAIVEYAPIRLKLDPNFPISDKSSINRINIVFNFINQFKNQKISPKNLSLNHLVMDRNFKVKTTAVLENDDKFNFTSMIKFVEEFSAGHKEVFGSIMRHSDLSICHVYANYLQLCFDKATKGELVDVEQLADTTSPAIEDRQVRELAKKTVAYINEAITSKYSKAIQQKCNVATDDFSLRRLFSTIGESIKHLYGNGFFLTANFQTMIVHDELVDDIVARGSYTRKDEQKGPVSNNAALSISSLGF